MRTIYFFKFFINTKKIYIDFYINFLSAVVSGSSAAAWQLEAGDALEIHHLQHVLGLRIDLDDILFQSGNVRNIVIPTFTLFFLQFDGNSTDCWPLKPFHQMSDEAGDFVTQRLGRNHGDFFNDSLVGVEIKGQFCVVSVKDICKLLMCIECILY